MRTNNKAFYVFVLVLIGIVCLILIVFYPFNVGFHISNNPQDWSNFGSYIGGVTGPLLSLLAFVGILISIANQNIESHKSEIENRILKYIEFHHNICNNVRIPCRINDKHPKEGRLAFEFLYEKELKTFYEEIETAEPNLVEEKKIEKAFLLLYNKHGKRFGFYFRNLFYVIKYIDGSKNIDNKSYSELIRAQLSTPEIQMLMYNCLSKKGMKFKNLVTKYGLINGIDEKEMIKPSHKEMFSDAAFE